MSHGGNPRNGIARKRTGLVALAFDIQAYLTLIIDRKASKMRMNYLETFLNLQKSYSLEKKSCDVVAPQQSIYFTFTT